MKNISIQDSASSNNGVNIYKRMGDKKNTSGEKGGRTWVVDPMEVVTTV